MACRSMSDLVKKLQRQLEFRDIHVSDDDIDILQDEIVRAIQEINRCRRFSPTEEEPYDMKYDDKIIPLCVTAFSKIGAERQTSHSENGVIRNYTSGGDYPTDMLNSIVPLIR